MIRKPRWTCRTKAALAALGLILPSLASASETRGYAVSWFHVAGYYDVKGRDCPRGLNPPAPIFYAREFKRLGMSPSDIEELIANPSNPKLIEGARMRGRIDGKPVNVYANPESAPDSHIFTVEGPNGYGFNLDGKVKPGDFTDPDTGEQGVDNNHYRVIGCNILFQQNKENRSSYPTSVWNVLMEAKPAHVIEISGIDDYMNDPDVTVGIYTSLDRLVRGPSGDPQVDMTLRVDPDQRWHNVVHGSIKNGVLTTDVLDVNLLGEPWWIQAFHFQNARLRLQMKPDGTLKGIMGAYHAWFPIYWQYGSEGWAVEGPSNIDLPGTFYALRRMADAYPDPTTGQNTAISTSYAIEGVPAFVTHTKSGKVAVSH